MHSHNPYHANDQPYAFDISAHRSEALPAPLLVRNRALFAIEGAMYSGAGSFLAHILPEHVSGVRLAADRYRGHKTHHVMIVHPNSAPVLKVVRRRHA